MGEVEAMGNAANVIASGTEGETSRTRLRSAEIQEAPPSERKAPGLARATLLQLTGPDAGRVFALDAESSILGRDPTADLQIAHSTVSRHHARVWRAEDGRYFVEDLGSANGTAISARCIARSELKPNDRLQLGPHIELRFVLDADEP
jgi:pSer/pThr/pTyr-binding forkhead associated (FHA) protein